MHIGNKLFPYPILNENKELSGYKDSSIFSLHFEVGNDDKVIIEEGKIVFKNLHFNLSELKLKELYDYGKVKGAFIVECSASTFRKSFDINENPYDLKIDAKDFKGYVVVSAFLYANEDIQGYCSSGFKDVYRNYKFDLDKFDILAVDDGGKFRVNMEPTLSKKASSIFTIVKAETNKDCITYTNEQNSIVIVLPKKYFDCYDTIKRKPDFNNIAFSMIAIPPLTQCLEEIKDNYDNVDDAIENNNWFESVRYSYKRETGNELDYDNFLNIDTFELAQIVLNYASCKGVLDFRDLISGETSDGGEDDEQD